MDPYPRHEQTQSQQDSVDTHLEQQMTPSTTEESVTGNGGAPVSSTEPLLSGPTLARKINEVNGETRPIPQLPNIIPIRGHLQQQGWL